MAAEARAIIVVQNDRSDFHRWERADGAVGAMARGRADRHVQLRCGCGVLDCQFRGE